MDDDVIVSHYLKRFDDKDRPDSLAGKRGVGMEAKFCLVDSRGGAVEERHLQGLFESLERKGWTAARDANLGILTGASKPGESCPALISTGTGHCKVEFSVPYGRTLQELESSYSGMARDSKAYADRHGIRFLCLGVHPVTEPSSSLVQKKSRHVFWDQAFRTRLVHLFALTADCQVHVDVKPEEVHDAVNVFQGLTGAQIALTANATVWKGAVDPEYLDVREAFWDWWLPDEERAGVVSSPFGSIEAYVDLLSSLRPVFVERDGRSLGIYHYPSFKDYFFSREKPWGLTPEGEKVFLEPREEDIDLHDTFSWYTARLSRYCTLENRANCQQPPEDVMAIPAMTLGLMENLAGALAVMGEHDWASLRGSRQDAVRMGMKATIDGRPLTGLCREVLEAAEEGLVLRGHDEERYLAPLWERLEEEACPALMTREVFRGSGVGGLLDRYSL